MKAYKPGKAFAILTCLTVCLNTMGSSAQVLSGLQNNFIASQKANLQEKIYVHTDKSLYLTGEILWFKLYNTKGSNHQLLDLSKVAYVELLDSKHNAVLQAKISLSKGTGMGSFYIPFSLSNGNYQLRAYTNWMKNFDADYFFDKKITIINPVKISPASPSLTPPVFDIQFFPEGGHLVQGLNSKIAFKVTGSDGKGINSTGAIVGPQNDTIARFKSLKFGIGSFAFSPLAQTGYKAIIKIGNSLITKDLPEISASGYVLKAIDRGENYEVIVQNNEDKPAGVYMIVHSRHDLSIAEHANLVNGTAHFNIEKSKLGEGISFITLFDERQQPLCERLIFKRPSGKLVINAEADAPSYATRKKVTLALTTNDQDNKRLAANLSLSVFLADSLQKEDAAHIADYLWLSADLKGRIEGTDYYLKTSNDETNQALDDQLISQGWTQFDWRKISAGQKPRFTFLPEYTGPLISGKMINTLTNKPAENIMAYLTVAGTNHQLYTAKSDSTGKLLFNTKDFYGVNELITQTKWQQDSTYRIEIINPFSEQYSHDVLPAFHLSADRKGELASNSLNMQVQNVFSTKQIKQFKNPAVDSTLFYGKPSYTYLLDDYVRFPTIEDVIHEYVRLISITRDHGKMGLQVLDDKKILPGQPLVMLDGRPIFDIDKAFLIDPLKIKRLDIVNTNYLYGPAIFNGILSFTTYDGSSINTQLDPRALVLDYEGLQQERKFYSPVYDTDPQIGSSIPDFRNVLYWNPKADTDPQGQRKMSFYTGDKPGRYIVVIEGLSSSGEAGSTSFYFDVKR